MKCLGYGESEGVCENEAGTPWTPLWCLPCDEERRSRITASFERILTNFPAVLTASPEQEPKL